MPITSDGSARAPLLSGLGKMYSCSRGPMHAAAVHSTSKSRHSPSARLQDEDTTTCVPTYFPRVPVAQYWE
jgi:hypothetical protein